jgi:hypothetical protein
MAPPMLPCKSIRQKWPLATDMLKAKRSAVGFPASETILLKDHNGKQNKIPVGLSEVHLCL